MFPIETFQASLAKLTRILQKYDIRFHLTGGLTGMVYGEPRMTQDIDVVIDPVATQASIEQFVDSLGDSCSTNQPCARESRPAIFFNFWIERNA